VILTLGSSILSVPDLAVVSIYIVIVFAIALRVRKGQSTQEDYFLGGRQIHWMLIAVSTFATLFSTISFVLVPAEAYQNGILLATGVVTAIPLLPIAVNKVLRHFFDRPTLTAYQYLEHRFNVVVRVIGAVFFLLARLLYMCVILYSASMIFSSVFGVSVYLSIVVVGGVTMFYTMVGGMRAVVLTDLMQSIMLSIGVVALFWAISAGINFEWISQWQELIHDDPRYGLAPLFDRSMLGVGYRDRTNLLMIVFAMVHVPFMMVSSDQLVVQRLLSTKGFVQARRAIYVNMGMGVIAGTLIWTIGVGLVLFYRQNPLPADIQADHVLGYFIQTRLASPLPGLLCAAMLAMIMSTIDSAINSLSAVLENDILGRLRRHRSGSLTESRLTSLGWGTLAIIVALVIAVVGEGGSLPVFELAGVLGAGWGILTVAFVLGTMTRWVRSWAMVAAMAFGVVSNIVLQLMYLFGDPDTRMSFAYTPIVPTLITLLVAVGLSLIRRRKAATSADAAGLPVLDEVVSTTIHDE
jgi:SSS family transporter